MGFCITYTDMYDWPALFAVHKAIKAKICINKFVNTCWNVYKCLKNKFILILGKVYLCYIFTHFLRHDTYNLVSMVIDNLYLYTTMCVGACGLQNLHTAFIYSWQKLVMKVLVLSKTNYCSFYFKIYGDIY